MVVLLILGCWIAIAVSVFAVDWAVAQRRSRTLEQAARALGFSFEPLARPFAGSDVRALTALNGDSTLTAVNVLRGFTRGCETYVFDLPVFPSSEAAVVTTFAAFRSPGGRLPVLQISARGLIDRLEDAFRKPPARPEPDHEFARQFVLHCRDEAIAREFLTPARLAELRLHANHFHIESSPEWVLIYRPGVKLKPEDLARFVEEASRVAAALLPNRPFPVPTAA